MQVKKIMKILPKTFQSHYEKEQVGVVEICLDPYALSKPNPYNSFLVDLQ